MIKFISSWFSTDHVESHEVTLNNDHFAKDNSAEADTSNGTIIDDIDEPTEFNDSRSILDVHIEDIARSSISSNNLKKPINTENISSTRRTTMQDAKVFVLKENLDCGKGVEIDWKRSGGCLITYKCTHSTCPYLCIIHKRSELTSDDGRFEISTKDSHSQSCNSMPSIKSNKMMSLLIGKGFY